MDDKYKVIEILRIDDQEDEILLVSVVDALLDCIQRGKKRLCVLICEEPVIRFKGG
jgi:hypothetical protein